MLQGAASSRKCEKTSSVIGVSGTPNLAVMSHYSIVLCNVLLNLLAYGFWCCCLKIFVGERVVFR